MARLEEYTDEDIERALIEANGQPTKAAEILDASYPHLYRRIRRNPELYEVQKAYRAKVFQNVSNLSVKILLTGLIDEPETDDEGNVVPNSFVKKKVDYRTRISMIPNVMNTFKGDDGIKDELEVSNGNIDISSWLKLQNTQNDSE